MTHPDTDGFVIPRHQQTELRELLAQIPALIEDLSITLTRQDRLGAGSGGGKRGRIDAPPLPINLAAMEARDQLHNTLAGWIRHTCNERGLTYDGTGSPISMAGWLTRWHIALALSEGAEEAIPDLTDAIRRCRRVCDRPADRIITTDWETWDEAMEVIRTRAGIADLCRTMGGDYRHITRTRIDTLTKKHPGQQPALTPARSTEIGGVAVHQYRLGDVIHAHRNHPRRTA